MNLPDQNSSLNELRVFSDIDYIITDLDGTFVQHGETVWKQLHGVQAKLHNSSPTITIATGRTYYGMKDIADDIRMKKNTPIILYNGAVVISYLSQNILYQKTIPNSVLYDLCRIINLNTQNIFAYYLQSDDNQSIIESVHGFGCPIAKHDINGMRIIWHDKLSVDKLGNNFDDLSFSALVNSAYLDNMEISLFQRVAEPCSILIDKNVVYDKLGEIMKYLRSSHLVSYTDSGSGYFEIKAQGVHKGTIFDFIRGPENKKCVAIGDNDKDVELLQGADIGVAVANASEAAANAAKYQCRQMGTNGVLELLEVIKAANRYWERELLK